MRASPWHYQTMTIDVLFTEPSTLEGFEFRTVRINAPEIGLSFTSKIHCANGATIGPEYGQQAIEAALKTAGWSVERIS